MSKSVDQAAMRMINQRLLLDTIYKCGPISRAELARMLSMSKPAVSDNLDELLRHGVIEETAVGAQIGGNLGRKPIPIRINRKYRYLLAIDLNYRDPVFALADFYGEIIADLSVKVDPELSFDARLGLIRNALHLLMNSNGVPPELIFCIGISSPGIFNRNNLLYSISDQFQKWFDGNLVGMLANEFGVPVFVKNDANTAAIGEYHYGAGKGSTDVLYLCCGMGFGSGLILNNRLYEGRRFSAGDISSYTDMVKHRQGKTIEDFVRIDALLERIRTDPAAGSCAGLAEIPPSELSFEHIVNAYLDKDPYIMKILSSIMAEIACVALGITYLLEIETVVWGGEYTVFYELFQSVFAEFISEKHVFRPVLKKAALGRHAGLYGLFVLARDLAFDELCHSANPLSEA